MSSRLIMLSLITLVLSLASSFAWGDDALTLSLSLSLASPTAVGAPVRITATPSTPGALEYRFRVKYTDTTGTSIWTTVQEYNASNTCTWRPPEAHVYTVVAYVRNQGTAVAYLAYRDQVITVNPAVTDLRVTLSVAAPSAPGTPVRISVTPQNGGTMEYRFKVKNRLPDDTFFWQTLQEYGVLSSCTWTPAEPQSYLLYVYAREKGSSTTYDIFKEIPFQVNDPVSSLLLAASCPSPTGVGTPVRLTATTLDGGTLEYKFYALYNDAAALPQTELIRDWSASKVVTWAPRLATTYTSVVALVREKSKPVEYDLKTTIDNYQVVPAVTSIDLRVSPASPSPAGMPITLTATATGGGSLEYLFKAKYAGPDGSQWKLLQGYGGPPTYTWTPLDAHDYTIYAYTREIGTTVDYKVFKELRYTVNSLPVIFNVTPAAAPVGTTVTLTGANLIFTTEVSFNGTSATPISNLTQTSLTVNVPAGATTGKITVVTAYGTVTTATDFTVLPPAPTITSFTPIRSIVGAVVTINGTNLYGTTAVSFNGTAATVITDITDTSLKATVPVGTTTGKISVTTPSGTGISATSFTIARNPIDDAEMVWVQGANFTMGTTYGGWGSGPATQKVTLSSYWLYKYDVTVAQYRAFCTATARALPAFPVGYSWDKKTGWTDSSLQQHPIVNVTWADACAYAAWAGVALPTEAQWEYAARGTQGKNYPWGGTATAAAPSNGWEINKCANNANSAALGKSTWPVGSFATGASWCDAQDMAGNVWQWCADWVGDYSATTVTNPTGPATGDYRALRGGSWGTSASGDLRSAHRGYAAPATASPYNGFRCASTAIPTIPPVPTLAGFTPVRATVGTVVTITGKNLAGVWSVRFNGTAALTITDVTATSLRATVPTGATSGKITVNTAGGTATSTNNFTVLPFAPTITGFAPTSALAGTVVTITGTNLTGATAVRFNGVSAANVTNNTATSLKATVPVTATTGKLSVTTDGGTCTSAANFTFIPPAPTITEFTPAIAPVGAVITVTGTYLSGATTVSFNGTAALIITDITATSLKATVPVGATSGKIAVTTLGGTATSVANFTLATNPVDNAEMLWIPGDTFTMGTNVSAWWNEPHTQQVTLSGYWIYKYEVTVAQYRAFCTATSRALPPWPGSVRSWTGKTGWDDATLQQHPIVNVSWDDAKAYATWAGAILPTEAQWEYAARGPQGNNFPWGGTATADDPLNGWDQTRCANIYTSSGVGLSTWPVGSFPTGASWCGAQDMAGNVDEWCNDCYGDYSISPVVNPTGSGFGDFRIIRGSHWKNTNYVDPLRYYRSAYRDGNAQTIKAECNGFRCASNAPAPQ